MGAPWTSFEDSVLAELYPLHGRDWDGWHDVLPDRGAYAIYNRAHRLGLRLNAAVVSERRSDAARARHAAGPQAPRADARARPDPLERSVMPLLGQGLPPSAIDARLGLEPGTARGVISKRWRRTRMEG